MGTVNLEELAKLGHLNTSALGGRTLRMLPVWDGENWNQWIDGPDGRLIRIQMVDAVHSAYLSKGAPAKDSDLWIHFIEFVWQRVSYPDLFRFIHAIEDDFHLLATSAAKLEHFHAYRASIDSILMGSFVRTEVEYMLVVARSVFDLLQEVISGFWNDHVRLLHDAADALKKQNRLPTTFAKIAFANDAPRSAEAITAKFALPPIVAEQYVKHTPFFASLRASRDRIVHGSSSVGAIFVTEKGFGVSPHSKLYGDYPWTEAHHYNENVVSLMPWVARIVFQTIEACTEIILSLASVIQIPEEIAPGHRVLLRDSANPALSRLLEAATGKRVWWNPDGGADQPTGSSPSSSSSSDELSPSSSSS